MPPSALIRPPIVSETALATTSLSGGVTCGSATLSADSRNRLTPDTASTAM
jgi:hypothetical protein